MTGMVNFSIQIRSAERVVGFLVFILSVALISIIYTHQQHDTLASTDVAIDTSGGGSASASADGRTISTGDSCTVTFTTRNGTAAAAAALAKPDADCLISSIPAQRNTEVVMNFLKTVEGKLSPLVYQLTVPLGQSSFASNALRPLVDVNPFSVIGGHVLLSSPSPHIKLIATSIVNNSIQNAAIVDLTDIKQQPQATNMISAAGQSLYEANLGDTIKGTNPFKGTVDTVTNITALMLWNEATSPIQFSDDSQVAMTIIYSGYSAAALASASGDSKGTTLKSGAAAIADGIGVSVP